MTTFSLNLVMGSRNQLITNNKVDFKSDVSFGIHAYINDMQLKSMNGINFQATMDLFVPNASDGFFGGFVFIGLNSFNAKVKADLKSETGFKSKAS